MLFLRGGVWLARGSYGAEIGEVSGDAYKAEVGQSEVEEGYGGRETREWRRYGMEAWRARKASS
jgi:hypothetical protein